MYIVRHYQKQWDKNEKILEQFKIYSIFLILPKILVILKIRMIEKNLFWSNYKFTSSCKNNTRTPV